MTLNLPLWDRFYPADRAGPPVQLGNSVLAAFFISNDPANPELVPCGSAYGLYLDPEFTAPNAVIGVCIGASPNRRSDYVFLRPGDYLDCPQGFDQFRFISGLVGGRTSFTGHLLGAVSFLVCRQLGARIHRVRNAPNPVSSIIAAGQLNIAVNGGSNFPFPGDVVNEGVGNFDTNGNVEFPTTNLRAIRVTVSPSQGSGAAYALANQNWSLTLLVLGQNRNRATLFTPTSYGFVNPNQTNDSSTFGDGFSNNIVIGSGAVSFARGVVEIPVQECNYATIVGYQLIDNNNPVAPSYFATVEGVPL